MNDNHIEQLKSENKNLQYKLRQSEARFHNIAAINMDGIIIIDDIQDIVYVNPQAAKILGKNMGELLGEKFDVPISSEYYNEIQITNPTDEIIDIELRVTPITWVDKPASFVALRDITERIKNEKLVKSLNSDLKKKMGALKRANKKIQEANRAKSAFLANMSHEIRTPLNAVIGMTELLLFSDLDTNQEHKLKTVLYSGETLLQLINDILDLCRYLQC